VTLKRRLLVLTALLGVTLLVQVGLTRHMRSGSANLYPMIRKDISQLPQTLAAPDEPASTTALARWVGKDANPEEVRKHLPYTPNDLVSRHYQLQGTGLGVNLYLVHSRQADDRKHHPEICIRDVTGAPEDLEARQLVYLDADGRRPVQRFRFRTGASQYTTVYYWHYTFSPLPQEGRTFLQVLYQRMATPAPSLTAQVTTTARPEEVGAVEKTFLVALDQALQKDYLPPDTVIGCDRLPIALTRR
jgi:hypothetical protein